MYLIIGAGPAGLSAAMALKDRKPFLIDKNDRIGGLAGTVWFGEFGFDIGPHHFHTLDIPLLDKISALMSDSWREVPITSAIHFQGRWIPYPFAGPSLLRSLPLRDALFGLADFLKARMARRSAGDNFLDWAENNFGRHLSRCYFSPYAEKVWGIGADQLSSEVGAFRVPFPNLLELGLNYLGLRESAHVEDPRFIPSFYPRRGIGEICARMLAAGGGESILSTGWEPAALRVENRRVRSVRLVKADGSGESRELECEGLVWTGALPDLLGLLGEPGPGLRYRGQRLLLLQMAGRGLLRHPYVYFADPDFPVIRASETTRMSADMAPPGQTGLCLEINVNPGDPGWDRDAEDLLVECWPRLEAGLGLRRSDLRGLTEHRVSHAYPILTRVYESQRRRALGQIAAIENLAVAGRTGAFSYANMDWAIASGFEAARQLKERASGITDH